MDVDSIILMKITWCLSPNTMDNTQGTGLFCVILGRLLPCFALYSKLSAREVDAGIITCHNRNNCHLTFNGQTLFHFSSLSLRIMCLANDNNMPAKLKLAPMTASMEYYCAAIWYRSPASIQKIPSTAACPRLTRPRLLRKDSHDPTCFHLPT